MRLPNGFGQISKIKKQKLRNPYRAMVTIGKTETGRPIQRTLKPKAYFRTYREAYEALLEYNRKNDPLNKNKTIEELYDNWIEEHSKNITDSRMHTISCCWKYLEPIKGRSIQSLRTLETKQFLEQLNTTPNIKKQVKSVLNGIYNYAVQYEYVESNIIKNITLSEKATTVRGRFPYSSKEETILWKHSDEQLAQIILIQCYSGWRPSELLELRLENINLEDGFMKGGLKTEAGKNRIVPIHSKIKELVEKNYKRSVENRSEYLFSNDNGNAILYTTEEKRYKKFLEVAGMDTAHGMHDGRVHFVTACKECNVDEYAIKYIVGHTISDITEKVYTKRNLNWLKEEIEKIK